MEQQNVEVNKLEAIALAEQIFQMLKRDVLAEIDIESQYDFLLKKYPSFSRTFQIVLHKMVFERRYLTSAFKRFLDKLHSNPGKGMEGFIERQADYAKFLYIEECKLSGRRYDANIAKKIWEKECNFMWSEYKKILETEKSITNEFEKEEAKHNKERKQELFEFMKKEYELGVEIDNLDLMDLDDKNADDLVKMLMTKVERKAEFPEEKINPFKEKPKIRVLTEEEERERIASFDDPATKAFFERKLNKGTNKKYKIKRKKNKRR